MVRSVVYDGKDLCIICAADGARKGVITFGPWLQNPLGTRSCVTAKGFGDGAFIKRGIDEFHVVPRRNHWYHSPEMAEVEKLARSFAATRKVITYGSSMGGYGAAVMSARLGVPAVALAPQFTLDADIAPWETRWREEAQAIGAFDNGATSRDGAASGYLFYDPFTSLDAGQASLFRARSNFTFVPCPFSGHATSAMVNRTYSLRRVVSDVLDGTFSTAEFLAARRAYDRGSDDMYVAMFYVRASARKKAAAADWAADRLLQLDSRLGAKSLRTLFTFEMRRGRKDLAKSWAKAASQLEPATPGDCFIAARLATHAELRDEARQILRHGLAISPANVALKRELEALG